jgi:hypothetical protein
LRQNAAANDFDGGFLFWNRARHLERIPQRREQSKDPTE